MILAVLIFSILLSIALGITNFISGQIKMIREVGYSVKAFYAADSGIEEVLLSNNFASSTVDGANYEIFCECCNPNAQPSTCQNPPDCPPPAVCPVGSSCRAPNYCLRAIGNYKSFLRGIQIDY